MEARLREAFDVDSKTLKLADLAMLVGSPSLSLEHLLPALDEIMRMKPPSLVHSASVTIPTLPQSPLPVNTHALDLVQGKAQEYRKRLLKFEPPLINKAEVDALAERVRAKEARLKEIEASLKPFQMMPADLTLAKLECVRLENNTKRL